MEPLAIVLLTYDRMEYAERTLKAVLEQAVYSGELHVHVADDGSPDGYREHLVEVAEQHPNVAGVTVSNSERGGYGASYNAATQVVHSFAAHVLPLEDDWELTRRLDLDLLVTDLADERMGCVRLGYIGYTLPLRGEFARINGRMYLLLDPDSPERHVFAGHPRLETADFEKKVGPWPLGLNAGATEHAVAGKRAARTGVVWPVDLLHPRGDLFAHIGTVQARTDQGGGA